MSEKKYINFKNRYDRFIVMINMDYFCCQVEEKMTQKLRGKCNK
jgi:hypothetical protein